MTARSLVEFVERIDSAFEEADLEVLLMRCRKLRVQRVVTILRDVLVGEWWCEEPVELCEQLLWLTNEQLENIGYTVVYNVWPGYRHVAFTAYRGQRALLDAFLAGWQPSPDEVPEAAGIAWLR